MTWKIFYFRFLLVNRFRIVFRKLWWCCMWTRSAYHRRWRHQQHKLRLDQRKLVTPTNRRFRRIGGRYCFREARFRLFVGSRRLWHDDVTGGTFHGRPSYTRCSVRNVKFRRKFCRQSKAASRRWRSFSTGKEAVFCPKRIRSGERRNWKRQRRVREGDRANKIQSCDNRCTNADGSYDRFNVICYRST